MYAATASKKLNSHCNTIPQCIMQCWKLCGLSLVVLLLVTMMFLQRWSSVSVTQTKIKPHSHFLSVVVSLAFETLPPKLLEVGAALRLKHCVSVSECKWGGGRGWYKSESVCLHCRPGHVALITQSACSNWWLHPLHFKVNSTCTNRKEKKCLTKILKKSHSITIIKNNL